MKSFLTVLFAVILVALISLVVKHEFFSPPEDYDYMLRMYGGKEVKTLGDPVKLAHIATAWSARPMKNLKFFESELDSPDPSHVKTGIYSIALLALAIDDSESDDLKTTFNTAFPVKKISDVLALHPDYIEWLSPLRKTDKAKLFTSLKPTYEEQHAAAVPPGK